MIQVKEADILERIEKMCDPDQDDGDWITRYDIVESADALKLHDTGSVSAWRSRQAQPTPARMSHVCLPAYTMCGLASRIAPLRGCR